MRADAHGTAQRQSYLHSLRSPAPAAWTDNRIEQANHLVGAVYVALKVIADQAASAVCNVYRLKDDARHAEDQDAREAVPYRHGLSQLMRQPNPKETGGMLRRRVVNQIGLTGTSLLWRLDDGLGLPAELWSIPTASAVPAPRSAAYPDGAYRVTPYLGVGPFSQFPSLQQAGGVVIPGGEVVRVDLPHPLVQYDAYSPLTACSLQLDTLDAIDRSRWYGMKQGVNPSAMIEVDPAATFPDQDELDRLKQEFGQKYGGAEGTGRAMILSAGLKASAWGGKPAEMGWESSWSQLVDFVLSVFGVTKSLAFMTTESSYASLYASLKQFNLFSMQPLLTLIADSLNVQLVWPHFGREYFVELVPAAIDDEQVRQQEITADDSVGLRTINERRAMRKLPPVPWGEVRCQPGRVTEKDPDGSLADTDPNNDDPEAAPELEAERPESGQGEDSLGEELPGLGKAMRKSATWDEGGAVCVRRGSAETGVAKEGGGDYRSRAEGVADEASANPYYTPLRKNYSGRKTDSLGRVRCYADGKPVPCGTRGNDRHAGVAKTRLARVLSSPHSATPADVAKAARAMQSMTLAELKGLAREHGLMGGATKAGAVKRILSQAQHLRTERVDAVREARKVGVSPRHMLAAAAEVRKAGREFAARVSSLVKDARDAYRAQTGKGLTRNHPAFRGGDAASIPGFDDIAYSLAGRYPDLLGDHGYNGDGDSTAAASRLYDYLMAGPPQPVRRRDSYAQALEMLLASPRRGGKQGADEVPF